MKKKFLGLVCLIYSFIIIYELIRGNLNNFLAPNMQIYLKISIIPFIIMGLVLLLGNIKYKFKITDLLLLLPFILVFFADDGNLSISIAKVKATTRKTENNEKMNTEKMYSVDYDIKDKKEDVKEVTIPQIEDFYFEIEDYNYSYLADYLTYMSGAYKYANKTIKVRGFAVDYSEFLTYDYFALGKYMVSCCAADAEFTGFMVKYNDFKIEYGKWYEVEGVLELGKDSEGYTIMTINAVNIKEIEKEKNQYVYSCDTYGKDACSKLLEYDLEY